MAIIKLKNVRLSFPDLFVPTAFEAGQQEKYGATFLIPKDDPQIKELETTILKVANEKWGAKGKATYDALKANPNKCCYQDGELKEYDGYAGCMSISAKNTTKPSVIDRDTSPLSAGDGKPYSGCYVDASLDIWAQDNSWGKGIRATLRWVQFRADGAAFSGAAPASPDEFESIADGADAESLV